MTATVTGIDRPGVYDLPVEEYLRDPVAGGSLSSSGARRLLPPSCPAKFRYWADEQPEHSREFDIGHAAHKLVLGAGPELVVIDASDYRTKAAREQRDDAYADGVTPVLLAEHQQVLEMAAALREHPVASRIFHPDAGTPEQTLVWHDAEFDVWRRALLDWLPLKPVRYTGRRLIVPDYKTAYSAHPDAITRAIDSYGYDQQLAWYLDAVTALQWTNEQPPAALLVVQEKTPPYLVTVVQLDPVALERGRLRNRQALDLYRRCRATDTWPGYADDVQLVGLPSWAEHQHELALERGDYELETR